MTIAEEIKSRVDTLRPNQQLALLSLLDTMGPPPKAKPRVRGKRRSRQVGFAAALRAAAGIWKGRTDLPCDSAEASMVLRRRLMRRSGHA